MPSGWACDRIWRRHNAGNPPDSGRGARSDSGEPRKGRVGKTAKRQISHLEAAAHDIAEHPDGTARRL